MCKCCCAPCRWCKACIDPAEYQKDELQETGLNHDRSCTDLIFLILFVVGWIVVIFVTAEAVANGGDPNKIIRGVDMYGRICGKSDGVADLDLAAWPYPLNYKAKVCVSSCDYTDDYNSDQMAWKYTSEKFIYYCLPTFVSNATSISISAEGEFFDSFESVSNMAGRAVGDVATTWLIILISAFLALFVAFGFTFTLQYIAKCLIWMCILLVLTACLALGAVLYRLGADAEEDHESSFSPERIKMLKYSGYAMFVICGIFLLVIMAMRNAINTAVEVVREAARAIGDMKTLVVFPLFPLSLACLYITIWVISCLFIFSVSSLEQQDTPSEVRTYDYGFENTPKYGLTNNNPNTMQRFELDEGYRSSACVVIFHLLWVLNFLFYFGYSVIAGSVATWYFSVRDSHGKKVEGTEKNQLPVWPVCDAMQRTCRYHLGTVALSAFIIAIIQAIRVTVKYIEEKMTPRGKEPNGLQSFILKVIHCCLMCAECCMDKISKNALIWNAVYGDSFFTSSCSSFSLLLRNLTRVAALNVVSTALLGIAKFTIAITTMFICGAIISKSSPWADEISSPIVPMIVIFILAYVVAALFMNVFDATIDCTFLCFLIDVEKNENKARMFASEELQALIGRHKKKSQRLAAMAEAHRLETIKQRRLRETGIDDGESDGEEGTEMEQKGTSPFVANPIYSDPHPHPPSSPFP